MYRSRTLIRLLVVSVFLMMISFVATAQSGSRQIIVLKSDVSANAQAPAFANAYGLDITHQYTHVLNGFAAFVPAGRINALRNDPRVAFVEPDLIVSIAQTESQVVPTGIPRAYVEEAGYIAIDGVDDAIDVDVAVLDTGIDFEHPDLNVVGGVDCTGGPMNTTCDAGGDDDHYHGTHVAGTIGALDNGIGVVGVAPGARLWAVKVLNKRGSGYTSGIVAGIDWVVAQGNIEVINMSLGGSGVSASYLTAIDAAVGAGVTVVVAAGNDGSDANNYSPAYVPSAITVSALADFDGAPGGNGSPTCRTDEDDTLANFSNWGSAVDIAAPGVCILSTYPLEQGAYNSISGTSMAAPHVAGAVALLYAGGFTDPVAIRNELVNRGNYNWTDDSGDGIQEPLLDMRVGTGNANPTASIAVDCTDLTCTFDGSASSDSDGSIAVYSWDFGDGNFDDTTGAVVQHTYAADGTYNVSLIVADNEGATGFTSDSVSVSEGSTGGTGSTVSVTDLDAQLGNAGKNWFARVHIYVVDDSGAAVSGATVTGTYDAGGSMSCNTDATGHCYVDSGQVSKQTPITYTVTDISASGLTYDASSNSDSEPDSDGTIIVVNW